jgi:hypothetical protein
MLANRYEYKNKITVVTLLKYTGRYVRIDTAVSFGDNNLQAYLNTVAALSVHILAN